MSSDSGRNWQPVDHAHGLPTPGGNYSPAIVAGDLVFLSGQVPLDPETGKIDFEAGVTDQTLQVLENIRALLEASGCGLEDVVAVTVYLADIGDWPTFNDVFGEFFSPPYPTRTVLGAELKGFKVEASASAVRRASG